MKKINIRIPKYNLKEELINAISHGLGGLLSIAALVLMIIKSKTPLAIVTTTIFGTTMILLYIISTIYHSLSPRLEGKKVLRVIDHCNVFLLVYGTYIPISLLGIKGKLGITLLSITTIITIMGIIKCATSIDSATKFEVACHLINGWGVLIGIPKLLTTMGIMGLIFLLLGGIMYTIGSILYGIGAHKKYMHSLFHIFCLLGTFFHFWGIYNYLL